MMVMVLLAIGYLLFTRVHHFFSRHCYHLIYMHLFTLLEFDSFSTYFESLFCNCFFLCVLNSDVFFFYLFLNVCLYSLKWQMMWTISKSHNGANEKKNQIKIESNKIKIDSNTKNVNVITFSFTSILWINVTAIHFRFVSFCYCRVVLCWIKRCIEQKKNTFKSNGAHVIS